jgi:hypothetical protein
MLVWLGLLGMLPTCALCCVRCEERRVWASSSRVGVPDSILRELPGGGQERGFVFFAVRGGAAVHFLLPPAVRQVCAASHCTATLHCSVDFLCPLHCPHTSPTPPRLSWPSLPFTPPVATCSRMLKDAPRTQLFDTAAVFVVFPAGPVSDPLVLLLPLPPSPPTHPHPPTA